LDSDFLGFFFEHGFLSFELLSHGSDRVFGCDKAIVTVRVLFLEGVHFATLFSEKLLESGDQLEVRSGGNVVVTLELSQELLGIDKSIRMEALHHLDTRVSDIVFHLNFAEELDGHRLQSVTRPFREPIDGGTVDQ
jgi:hypothetical protein